MVRCRANKNVGNALVNTLRLNDVDLTGDALLRLELVVAEEEELPLVWFMAATLLSIWEQRQQSLKVEPYLVRAQLEAKVNLLRKSRYASFASTLDDKIRNMFEYIES